MENKLKEFFTVGELSVRYRVSTRTIYRWAESGKLQGFRASDKASWRFDATEIAKFEGRAQA